MGVTRDPDYPAEMAQLVAAFNRCADGHPAQTVLNASAQMVAAAIGYMCRESGASKDDAVKFAAHVGEVISKEVALNWSYVPTPTDIIVDAS